MLGNTVAKNKTINIRSETTRRTTNRIMENKSFPTFGQDEKDKEDDDKEEKEEEEEDDDHPLHRTIALRSPRA